MKQLSEYYVAQVVRSECWLLSSAMRGTEHVAFDRCIDKEQSIFEFFVPQSMEPVFLQTMDYLKKVEVLLWLEKRPNRLLVEDKL